MHLWLLARTKVKCPSHGRTLNCVDRCTLPSQIVLRTCDLERSLDICHLSRHSRGDSFYAMAGSGGATGYSLHSPVRLKCRSCIRYLRLCLKVAYVWCNTASPINNVHCRQIRFTIHTVLDENGGESLGLSSNISFVQGIDKFVSLEGFWVSQPICPIAQGSIHRIQAAVAMSNNAYNSLMKKPDWRREEPWVETGLTRIVLGITLDCLRTPA